MSDNSGPFANLKELHGRGMNNLSDHYKLPADAPEMERLSRQHRMWCLLMGGLYPPALNAQVEEVLAGSQSTLLDLGCGSGIRTIEMAKAFPHVKLFGIDLARNQQSPLPDNVQFLQGDLTKGLPNFKNKADLVHCRTVTGHLADPQALMDIIADCLKPGGILLLSDGDVRVWDERKEILLPLLPPGSWPETSLPSVFSLPTYENLEPARYSHLAGYLYAWGMITVSPLYKPVQDLVAHSHKFQGGEYHDYRSPIGWSGYTNEFATKELGEEIGLNAILNTREFLRGCKPRLLASGLASAETMEEWIMNAEKELVERRLYLGWHFISARRV